MTATQSPYPVRVDGQLDEDVSRWSWLVKWLLLVPHLVVLAFLWLAFVVVWVIALVSILVTGRYPRPLFDYSVGVLRWTWRVHHYGYAALGTDRYPPFTLADVPDHPAHLDVDHPEHLSRGLVLVKWWLLVLPHWLGVGIFAGGGLWLSGWSQDGADSWGAGGLIGLLVLVAAVVLLFTGRYPRPLYDFVLGMDRWVVRVVAYAALLTDEYPPFRLDTGGTDPGSSPFPPPPVAPAGTASPPSTPTGDVAGTASAAPGRGPGAAPGPAAGAASRWTAGRVVALVLGALLAVAATGPLIGGGALLWADRTQRDGGWLTGPPVSASTAQAAFVGDRVVLPTSGEEWLVQDVLGRVRLAATSADGEAVFVGVATTAAVARYLDGVGHTTLHGWGQDGDMMSGGRMVGGMSTDTPGGPPATAPGEQGFWTASTQGTGTQTLEWTPSDGDWTVVVMPADRSRGMTVELAVAATAPGLTWLAAGLLGGGVVALAGGVVLIAMAVHRASARPVPPAGADRPVVPVPAGP